MEKKLREIGLEVGEYICKSQAALAAYNFWDGNLAGSATGETIAKIRDLLADVEMLSRQLTPNDGGN